jgi:hypothetical protein
MIADMKNATFNLTLFMSVPFSLDLWGKSKKYVQVGNAANVNLALLPYETSEERETAREFVRTWNQKMVDNSVKPA